MVYGYDPQNRLTTVTNIEGQLSAACDVDLTFTTDSNAPWFLQTEEYYYDGDAVQSGDIDDSEETWLQTTVTGSGYLRFRYKRSCEYGDEFTLFIDGQYRFGCSGSIDGSWTESGAWYISGSGTHTIRWRYSKNGSGSAGEDCVWVDYVRWSGTMPDAGAWGQIEYVYDPSGRRVEKKVDGDTELKFLYDGDHIIAEYDANDTLLRKYVHGPCIDEPICLIESSGTYAGTQYYHFDALGSVVAMTDPNGDVVQLYEYSVYGQVAASDANHPNRFMFTGREFDKDTGLYYYRARYYHPEIGRFLQTDPIGYGDGMNWYAYCRNNSMTLVDPLGLLATTSSDEVVYYEDVVTPAIGRSVRGGDSQANDYYFQNYDYDCSTTAVANLYVAAGKLSHVTGIINSDYAKYIYNADGQLISLLVNFVPGFCMDYVEAAMPQYPESLKQTTVLGPDHPWWRIGINRSSYVASAVNSIGGLESEYHDWTHDDISLPKIDEFIQAGKPVILAFKTKGAHPGLQQDDMLHVVVVRYCQGATSWTGAGWESTPYEIIDGLCLGSEKTVYLTQGKFEKLLKARGRGVMPGKPPEQ